MNATEFSHFAQEHRQRFAGVALNFFHDVEAADDIVQDSLLRLWLVRERLTEESDFVALGIRIAKNLCVNEWKRRQVRATDEGSPPDPPSAADTAAPLEEAENQTLLARALERCTPTERRIFQLWQNEQLEAAQIADILQCKTTTVSQTLSKVRRKIFTLIQSQL